MNASLGSGEASLHSQYGRAATGRRPRRCDRLVRRINGDGRVVRLGRPVLGRVPASVYLGFRTADDRRRLGAANVSDGLASLTPSLPGTGELPRVAPDA